jgi:hypothetical protein
MDMKIKKIKDARKNEQIVQASHTAACGTDGWSPFHSTTIIHPLPGFWSNSLPVRPPPNLVKFKHKKIYSDRRLILLRFPTGEKFIQ